MPWGSSVPLKWQTFYDCIFLYEKFLDIFLEGFKIFYSLITKLSERRLMQNQK